MTTHMNELRNKSVEDLKNELQELLREQFNLRMQKATPGARIRPHLFKQVRCNIARVKNLIHARVKQQ